MKRLVIIITLSLMAWGTLCATHFVCDWLHTSPQNPYLAHNIYVRRASVNGVPLGPGDEVAIFDGDTCVGMEVLTESLDPLDPLPMRASTEGGGVPGSARIGEFIIFKVWVQATDTEYSYPEMSVWFEDPTKSVFISQGSSFIGMLSYTTPSSDTSIPIAENSYAPVPMVYPDAHLTITDLGATYYGAPFNQWVPNVVTTAGEIRVIYVDAPPIGVGFVGEEPDVYSQFHWYIDPGTVGFTASETYPIVIQIDTTELDGFIDYTDVVVYKRSIHGTPSFEACDTVWNDPYLVVTITDFSEFVLTGPISSTLPVELSSFTGSLALGNSVMLQWITQSETNLAGYRIFRSLEPELESAVMLDAFVEATNSSQTQTYAFYDRELYESGTYYYWLQSMDLDGTNDFHGPVMVAFSPSEPGAPPIVYIPGIKSIYPNPFNPTTTISYALDREASVRIDIFNVRGQLVKSFDCGYREAGEHRIDWDATDRNGSHLAGGLYIIRLDLGSRQFSRKVILNK